MANDKSMIGSACTKETCRSDENKKSTIGNLTANIENPMWLALDSSMMEPEGSGGFSDCYKVTYRGRIEFWKILKRDIAKSNIKGWESFYKEMTIGKTLKHRNLVPYYDTLYINDNNELKVEGMQDSGCRPCLRIKYLTGYDSLDVTIADRKKAGTALTADEKDNILNQLLEVVEYLHDIENGASEDITHGDIKPENIMIPYDSTRPIKLVDFGLAYAENWKPLSSGTPGFSAPEQFGENPVFNIRCDIYAIGKVINYLDANRYASLVAKAIPKDPHERYASIGQMRKDLSLISNMGL